MNDRNNIMLNPIEVELRIEIERLNIENTEWKKENERIMKSYQEALMCWHKQIDDDESIMPKIRATTQMMIAFSASSVMLTLVQIMSNDHIWQLRIGLLVLVTVLFLRQNRLIRQCKQGNKQGA